MWPVSQTESKSVQQLVLKRMKNNMSNAKMQTTALRCKSSKYTPRKYTNDESMTKKSHLTPVECIKLNSTQHMGKSLH